MADLHAGAAGVDLLGPPGGSSGRGAPAAAGWRARVRAHLAQPFFRNAYALVLNTGFTGALGLLYWLLAAQRYRDADIGRGSTAISLMVLLSGLVAFNVTGTLNRFLPQSGRSVRRLIAYAYLLTCGAVLLLTLGFLATLRFWGPSFGLLRDPQFRLVFVVAVLAAGIFTVEDGVLTGLRSAVWVPAENTLFGLGKLALLVVLARTWPHDGVFLSWVLPMVIVLLPTNALIFFRLVPRHLTAAAGAAPGYTRGDVGRFLAADYVGALLLFATVNLVPVMVADRVPPATYAHFFIAWVIGSVLTLVAANLATSLTVEGVYDRATLVANGRAALVRALGLLLVAAVLVSLAAPYALRAFGVSYLPAVALLQLLGFAALARAVTDIHVGVLRATGRTRQIARVQVGRGGLVLIAVFLCLNEQAWLRAHLGLSPLTAVGWAVLLSQFAVALLVVPSLMRFLRGAPVRPRPVPARPVVPPPDGGGGAEAGPPRPSRTERRRGRLRDRLPTAGVVVVAVMTEAAVPLFVLPLRGVSAGAANGFGLVSVLPIASLLGLALLVLAFGCALSLRRAHPVLLGAQVVLLVLALHGVTTLVEREPRFPTAWIHAGFVDYIARTGTVDPGLDARFSWPGFFALVASVLGRGHEQALREVLTYTPVVSNLLYLLPVGLLLRALRAGWRARWFALFLFPALNWVGQDYFSPQGFTYLLYLVFVAGLVAWFGRGSSRYVVARHSARRAALTARWRRWFPPALPGERAPALTSARERSVLLLLLIGVFTAATVSHQLTPIVMLFAAAALVLAQRCSAKGLPVLLGVILVGWLSYMTVAYWSGHLAGLLSGLGDLTGNLSTSVAGRAQGSNAQHGLVLLTRIGTAVVVLGLAGIGLLRRRMHGIADRTLAVLLLVPFSAVLLQDYGGEIALRIYLFSLPGACCLVAFAFFPRTRGRPGPLSRIAAVAGALALVGAFLVARYGNESFEQIRPGEVAAVNAVYQGHPSGALVLYPSAHPTSGDTPFEPLGYRDIETVHWDPVLAPRNPAAVAGVVAALRAGGPEAVLVTTTGQEQNLRYGSGYPADWGARFRRALAAAPGIRVVDRNSDAAVYAVSGAPAAGPARSPGTTAPRRAPGVEIGATPWTDVGVAFLLLLVVVLGWRELWRLRLAPGEARRLRPLTAAGLPLLLALAAVVVERLYLLSR